MAVDESAIRAAVTRLEAALGDPDPTAWVYEYTEDAVFDAGGAEATEGRDALLELAHAMGPLSRVRIRPLRIEGGETLATVWFEASWVSGGPGAERDVDVRGMLLFRREPHGRWRVAMEHVG